jgi:hypothetical protein
MDGDIADLIEALRMQDQTEQLETIDSANQ